MTGIETELRDRLTRIAESSAPPEDPHLALRITARARARRRQRIGLTALAAAVAAVVVAVPVGSAGACAGLTADEVVCLVTPRPFGAVGRWYADFGQATDDEVRAALAAPPT